MKNRGLYIFDFLLIILILTFNINCFISTYLKRYIIEKVEESGKIKLKIDDLDLNIFTGFIEGSGIKINSTDTSNFSSKIEQLSLTHFSILSLLSNKEIRLKKIEVNKTDLLLGIHDKDTTDNKASAKITPEKILGMLGCSSIFIGDFKVVDFSVYVQNISNDIKPVFISKHSELDITNILIQKNKSLYVDSIRAEINKSTLISDDSLYTLLVDQIKISSQGKFISLDKIKMNPNFDKKEFSRRYGSQTDRFEIFTRNLRLSQTDIFGIFNNELHVKYANIDSASIRIYRDKYFEPKKERKKMIRQILNALPVKIDIETCSISGSDMVYEELIPPSNDPGKLQLSSIDANIYNISNVDTASLVFESKSYFDKASPMTLRVEFPKDENVFFGKGSIKKLVLKNINSFIEPGSSIGITNGIIDTMQFNFITDTREITGTLLMLYHNLRVTAVNPDTRDSTGIFNKIKTVIANEVVLKTSNIDDQLKRTEFKRTYNNNKFMIYNILHSVLDGMKATIK